ncbi:MAG: HAMP domain-containing histidine kinase [Planctomycetes bacterium]|nr:HAMP domain-containing histidine kinase [Planctomycetota bacterium]
MYKRLLIVSAIIFTALAAFAILGFHSISLHAEGLEGKRIVAFSEVAEQIRIDVKQKLDTFIQTEQKRPYTDYQYFYAPDTFNNGFNRGFNGFNNDGNIILRSPLANSMSHGMAYGHFQIEPDGKIVSPFYVEGQSQQLDSEKQLYVSNLNDNVTNSLKSNPNAIAYLEIQRRSLVNNSLEQSDSRLTDQRKQKTGKTKKTISQKKSASKWQQQSAKNARANYNIEPFQKQLNQKSQIVTRPRNVVYADQQSNKSAMDNGNIYPQADQISQQALAVEALTNNQTQNSSFQQQAGRQTPGRYRRMSDTPKNPSPAQSRRGQGERQGIPRQLLETQQQVVAKNKDNYNNPLKFAESDNNSKPQPEFETQGNEIITGLNGANASVAQNGSGNANPNIPDAYDEQNILDYTYEQSLQMALRNSLTIDTAQQQAEDMVQIRIEPFVPITVNTAAADEDTFFDNQVFLLRHVQIEENHFLQGFRLNEKELVKQVRESASRLVRGGMGFELSKNESDTAAHAAVLDFGFGRIVLNLIEMKPQWINNQVSQLKNWYFAIVTIVLIATLVALVSLWRNLNAQVKLARKKDDFISAVSHELRTPLTTIRMYTEMLEKNWIKTDDKRSEYYSTMLQESERLTRLIENVLDFSRIQRGKKRYNFALGDINSCISEVVEMMAPCAAKQNFEIITELGTNIQSTSFDNDAVMQIVINLIDNALKYAANATDKTITIRTRTEGKYVLIEVADHGPGIPHTQRKKIFDEFYRIAEESKRETTGTGLGLALVKKFAQAHNGFVEAISAKPNGALLRVAIATTTQA